MMYCCSCSVKTLQQLSGYVCLGILWTLGLWYLLKTPHIRDVSQFHGFLLLYVVKGVCFGFHEYIDVVFLFCLHSYPALSWLLKFLMQTHCKCYRGIIILEKCVHLSQNWGILEGFKGANKHLRVRVRVSLEKHIVDPLFDELSMSCLGYWSQEVGIFVRNHLGLPLFAVKNSDFNQI